MSDRSEQIWQAAFRRTLRENGLYRNSLQRLTDAKVPEDAVLSLLCAYCDEAGRKNLREVQVLSQHVEKLIKEALPNLALLHAQLTLQGEELTHLPYGWPLESSLAIDDKLADLVVELNYMVGQLAPFAVKRGTGRDEATLVRLCLLISSLTDAPRWEDIANLLEAGEIASGEHGSWTADKVRKVYERYEQRHSAEFKALKELAEAASAGFGVHTVQSRSSSNRRDPADKTREVPPAYFRK